MPNSFDDLGFQEFDSLGFQEHPSEPQGTDESSVSAIESAIRGGAQGFSSGFEDEVVGGIKAAGNVAFGDGKLDDIKALYEQYRNLERSKNRAAEEANPKTYFGSQIAGGVGSLAIPGMQAATVGKAAGLSALNALGATEADLVNPTQESTTQAGIDVILGTILGAGGQILGNKLTNVAPAIKQKIGDKALSWMGAGAKDFEKELGGALADPNYRRGTGEAASKYVSMSGGSEGTREAINSDLEVLSKQKAPLIKEASDKFAELIKSADPAVQSRVGENSLINRMATIKNELVEPLKNASPNIESVGRFSNMVDEYAARVAKNDMDVAGLEKFRKELQDQLGNASFVKETKDQALEDQLVKKTYLAVKNRIEELSDIAQPGLGSSIKDTNNEISKLMDLKKISFKDAAKDAARSGSSSMLDFALPSAATAIGTATMGPLGGVLAGAGTLAAKKGIEAGTGFALPELAQAATIKGLKAAQPVAELAGKAINAKTIAPIANVLAQKIASKNEAQSKSGGPTASLSKNVYDLSPEDYKSMAQSLMEEPSLTSHAESLLSKLESGDESGKNAILFSLMQNPKARRLLNPAPSEE